MLHVLAESRPSAIHGTGLFAAEPIPAGTLVWSFDPVLDRIFPLDAIMGASEQDRVFLLTYCYYCSVGGGFVLCGDGTRYINHSDTPNLGGGDKLRAYALRDIAPGEELTEDYRTYDPGPIDQWSGLLATGRHQG